MPGANGTPFDTTTAVSELSKRSTRRATALLPAAMGGGAGAAATLADTDTGTTARMLSDVMAVIVSAPEVAGET